MRSWLWTEIRRVHDVEKCIDPTKIIIYTAVLRKLHTVSAGNAAQSINDISMSQSMSQVEKHIIPLILTVIPDLEGIPIMPKKSGVNRKNQIVVVVRLQNTKYNLIGYIFSNNFH